MRRMSIWSSMILGAFTCTAIASAGNEMGNGVDPKSPDSGAAWFLGDRSIRYCYEAAANFGVQSDAIEHELDATVRQWNDYIEAKHLRPRQGAALTLDTNFSRQSACDGKEDLKFYFGVSSPAIVAAKITEGLINPLAFAHREAYDQVRGWGRGFIWVASSGAVYPPYPQWERPSALHGILLHELGHVLGFDHVVNTIMWDLGVLVDIMRLDPDTSATQDIAGARERLEHIDQSQELYACVECALRVPGTLISDVGAGDAFYLLTGRQPAGEVKAAFVQDASASGASTIAAKLVVSDARSEEIFPVSLDMASRLRHDSDAQISRRFRSDRDQPDGTAAFYAEHSTGTVFFGTLTRTSGEPLTIVLGRNMLEFRSVLSAGDDQRINLSYIAEGKRILFFQAKRVP